jgi:hypothetical protein
MTEQPPVVAMAEIGDMLALSRKRVAVLTNGSDFPSPIATLTAGRIWDYGQVKAWAERSGRTVHQIPRR